MKQKERDAEVIRKVAETMEYVDWTDPRSAAGASAIIRLSKEVVRRQQHSQISEKRPEKKQS